MLRRALVWLTILLGGLFALRLAYGFVAGRGRGDEGLPHFGGSWEGRKNYASLKADSARGPGDQKYEKVATVRSESGDFARDERARRAAVPAFPGIVQFEQASGLPGRRALAVAVAVPPEQFDPLLARVRQIGRSRGRSASDGCAACRAAPT
jgi:hypothetical protein